MKLPDVFIERRDSFLELLNELKIPYVLAYSFEFDDEGEPLKAHLFGAGKTCTDTDILLTALGQAAYVKLYKTGGIITPFSKKRSVIKRKPEPPEPEPTMCILEECST